MGRHLQAGATRRLHGPWRYLAALSIPVIVASVAALLSVTTASAAPAISSGGMVFGTPCTASARACVDLAGHRAWLLDGDRVVRGPVPMMDGADNEPTPPGTYAVEWKAQRWTSREFGTPMPYAVFFAAGGISFHEGRQNTPSAGCVKLGPEDARAWFAYLQVGDQVQVR